MDNAKDSPLYRKENCRVVIGSETVFIDCPERFAWLLEEKLGEEAADYFRGTVEELTFDPDFCPGECDRTYKMQEHYERVIRDALEILTDAQVRELTKRWTSGKVSIPKYYEALKILQAEL